VRIRRDRALGARSVPRVALLLALAGCERSTGTDTAAAPSPVPASDATDDWRFRPTFERSLPPGVHGIPLIEASLPDHAQVRIVAATGRVEGGALGIEIWTYDQRNPEDVLALLGPPEPILRLDPEQPSSPALGVFRRQLAAPGTKVVHPMGLPLETSSPEDGVALLQSTARTVRDANAETAQRVEALARLVRGLDDALVLEVDAVGEILLLLGIESDWKVERVEALSTRRQMVHTHCDAGRRVMTWMKKPGGWVLAEITAA
jgi:hypothetical protein